MCLPLRHSLSPPNAGMQGQGEQRAVSILTATAQQLGDPDTQTVHLYPGVGEAISDSSTIMVKRESCGLMTLGT